MSEQSSALGDAIHPFFQDLMRDGMPDYNDVTLSQKIWDSVEEMGITNLFLPENLNGFDGNWCDANIVFHLLGFHAIPLPIGETIIARKLLLDANVAIPTEPISFASNIDGQLIFDKKSKQLLFTGKVFSLPWADVARYVLIPCDYKEKYYLLLLSSSDTSIINERKNEASEPRYTLQFTNAPANTKQVKHSPFDTLMMVGALLRSCQIAGAIEAAMQLTIQYAKDRKQFGRPIAKFQAIQHQLAELAEETAAVSCAAKSASIAMMKGDALFEIAAAKLRANHSVGKATSISHQIHGAIGFTQEHSLHYYTQRLWSWRSEFGHDAYWANLLGNMVVRSDEDNFWTFLTMRGDR